MNTASAMSIGFKIVWSVLYEHREYNQSRLFLKHAYITTTHFQGVSELAAAWDLHDSLDDPVSRRGQLVLQPESSAGSCCHRVKVIVGAYMWACKLPDVVLA